MRKVVIGEFRSTWARDPRCRATLEHRSKRFSPGTGSPKRAHYRSAQTDFSSACSKALGSAVSVCWAFTEPPSVYWRDLPRSSHKGEPRALGSAVSLCWAFTEPPSVTGETYTDQVTKVSLEETLGH